MRNCHAQCDMYTLLATQPQHTRANSPTGLLLCQCCCCYYTSATLRASWAWKLLSFRTNCACACCSHVPGPPCKWLQTIYLQIAASIANALPASQPDIVSDSLAASEVSAPSCFRSNMPWLDCSGYTRDTNCFNAHCCHCNVAKVQLIIGRSIVSDAGSVK